MAFVRVMTRADEFKFAYGASARRPAKLARLALSSSVICSRVDGTHLPVISLAPAGQIVRIYSF